MDSQYAMPQTATLAIANRLLHFLINTLYRLVDILHFHIEILHYLVDILPIIIRHLCLLIIELFDIIWDVFKYFTHLLEVRSNRWLMPNILSINNNPNILYFSKL